MYVQVTFAVMVESEEEFMTALDEDAVAAALPGPAWLLWVEEKKGVSDAIRAAWRKLGPS